MQFTKSVLILTALSAIGLAAPPNRVLVKTDDNQRVFLNGNIHPKAQAQYDQGRVSSSLQVTHVTLHFKLSTTQQADLEQLLKDQQDPSSPSYHQWLTPEQYGARFGVSDADLAQTTAWLASHGLTVTGTARARNHITFDGSAANIEGAFQAELHNYLVDGEQHFANASEPSIPAALQPVVGGIHGLNNFRLKPHLSVREVLPNDTTASGHHYIAPDDFAILYDLQPLYAAGFDGTGQKLVIVGQTALQLTDLEQFRAAYNLPGADPTVVAVPNAGTQGVNKNDLQEADLDLEWSGAIARNATIIYVYSPDVFTSMTYAVDQNLAPVVSMSYGACEAQTPTSQANSMRALAQQANSQGITWFNASGDSGAADCASSSTSSSGAVLAVDFPASVPEVTGVGGTEFNEGTGTYWNATNGPNSVSALSYIPETSWNDSAIDGSPSASGGGASSLYTKPSWQTGPGVPSDGARDVPDISLNASADHDGYDTMMGGKTYSSGGTSAPTPIFAGIAAILNQYLVQNGKLTTPGLGNINPTLYNLAQSSPSAFHDITTGNNIVTVTCTGRRCPAPTTTNSSVGYNAGPGYDQVTGLGSVDIYNLFQAWSGAQPTRLTPQIVVSASATSLAAGQTTVLTATVSSSNGATPTGTITFVAGSTTLGSATLSGSGGTSTATLTVGASQLASGVNNITAEYSSDSQFNSAAATVSVTVATSPGSGPAIAGVADGASFAHKYAPGEILSVFGSGLAGSTGTAISVPLPATIGGITATISGVTAPLFMVSPTQINVQIPYQTAVNSTATLVLNSGGQNASYQFNVSPTAPAIFTDSTGAPVPNGSGKAGSTITLFITGAGAVSPSVATGAAPKSGTAVGSLPAPTAAVSVTVGGANAPVTFAGIPAGLVGVTQINYTVPSGLPTGVHPVVVTVGNATSAQANLTITP
jgi:uncharacterized protein (TIGR03437 family)